MIITIHKDPKKEILIVYHLLSLIILNAISLHKRGFVPDRTTLDLEKPTRGSIIFFFKTTYTQILIINVHV
jgi:hypothetical protein